jgi:hypothetical protein
MADGKGGWIITRGISVREAAEWVGFKIEKLNEFSATTRKEFKAKVINSIINDFDSQWEEQRHLTALSANPFKCMVPSPH